MDEIIAVQESSDVWRSLDPEVSAQLLVAYYCGDERMEYTLEALPEFAAQAASEVSGA